MIARQKITETERTIEMDIQVDANSDNSDWRAIYAPKKYYFNNGDFATIFQPAMGEIAMSDMSKDEFRILFALIANMDMDSRVETKINSIAQTLSMNKGNVSKAINKLVDRNIIVKKRENSRYAFEVIFSAINSNLAYRGKIKKFRKGDPKILITDQQIQEEKYKQLEFDNFNDRAKKEQ